MNKSVLRKKDPKFSTMGLDDKVKALVGWLEEKQARDITALDVRPFTPATDAMVLATSNNVRHAQGLADHLMDMAAKENLEVLGMEGYKSGQWILLDFNDVIIHIFYREMRGHFNLEGLWSKAEVLYKQEASPEDDPDDYGDEY